MSETCKHYRVTTGFCHRSNSAILAKEICYCADKEDECPFLRRAGATSTCRDTAPETLEKNVNHPKRYTKGKIECIDALESAVVGKTPEEAICVANIIKYLWRYEEKEPLRSLKSAEWYLKRLISKYEANNAHHG